MKPLLILLFAMPFIPCSSVLAQTPSFNEMGITQRNSMPPIKWIPVQGGTFLMGCTAEQGTLCTTREGPVHEATVEDFEISQFEITNEQFCYFLNAQSNKPKNIADWIICSRDTLMRTEVWSRIFNRNGKYSVERGFEKHPVTSVSWFGAKAFCTWTKCRLPFEAEWEYAARGGNKSSGYIYSGSNNIDEVAWYTDNTKDKGTRRVGTKKANELGIYDMSGNVWEWCDSTFVDYKTGRSRLTLYNGDPLSTWTRVIRGGCWLTYSHNCRVSFRYEVDPYIRSIYMGFRVCRDAPQRHL